MAIDWKTIISEFDGKPTLLQAIGKLRKAVEDETITIQQAQAEIAKLESQQKADEALITTAQTTANNAQSAAQAADTKAQQALDLATTNETDIAALQNKASIEITLEPSTVTSGTLTDEQYTTLSLNDNCYIKLNEVIYTLSKNLATGVLIYTSKYLSDNKTVKTITVTKSTKAWVMTEVSVGKIYQHYIYFSGEFGTLISDGFIKTLIYSSSSTPFEFNDLYHYLTGIYIPAFGAVLANDYQTEIGLPNELSAVNSKLRLSWFKFSENKVAYENVTSETCYINDTVTEV